MDDDAVLDAIRAHEVEAADALAAIQTGFGEGNPLTAASLTAAAGLLGRDLAELWLAELKDRSLVTAFVTAMQARGVAFEDDVLADPEGQIATEALERFLPRARAFRCRILKDGNVAGSGVLVGPSLVLTAWHVIAVKAPGQAQVPAPNLSIVLADDTKQVAGVPAALESLCGDGEYDGVAPKNDDDVVDRNDMALLAMDRPAAVHLGYVPLVAPAPPPRSQSVLLLVHFPEGQDKGIGFGRVRKIRNVTARWRHDVATAGGSSGGACFNRKLELVGIHQGQLDNEARFVPLERFLDSVVAQVALDVAPPGLWSLDGTPQGRLVVGRADFFRAVATAGEPGRRVRGVRVKRRAVEGGVSGLAFSHDILEQLLARRGPAHRLVRVTQDEIVPDLVTEIRRRAALGGITVPDPPAEPGVATGAAPPETIAKHRAAALVAAIEAAAAAEDLTVWFFFDNPTVTLPETSRLALEGFVSAALVQAHVRLVIAGFETLPLPGEEFRTANPVEGDRSPGLVVEMIGGFLASDIKDFVSAASRDLTGAIDDATVDGATKRALIGIEPFNQVYDDAVLPTVTERLRLDLDVLAAQGGSGG